MRKRFLTALLAVMLIAALGVISASAEGTTVTVTAESLQSGVKSAIESAVEQAGDGGTVILPDGTFTGSTEEITVGKKEIAIKGAEDGKTALNNVTFSVISSEGEGGKENGNPTNVQETKVTFSNLAFTGTSQIKLGHIQLQNFVYDYPVTTHVKVDNCEFNVEGQPFNTGTGTSYNMDLSITNSKFLNESSLFGPYAQIISLEIKDNTIGTEENRLSGNVVKMSRRQHNTTISVTGNNIYADVTKYDFNVFELWQSGTNPYNSLEINVENNKIDGEGSGNVYAAEVEDTVRSTTYGEDSAADAEERSTVTVSGNTLNGAESNEVLAAAKVGDTYYPNLHEAIAAADGTGATVELLRDISYPLDASDTKYDCVEWSQLWDIDNVTIDGNGHKLTISKLFSNGNHNAIITSDGNLTVKDLVVDFSELTLSENQKPCRGFAANPGDVYENVEIKGNDNVGYGITVGGTDADNETITITGCKFENCVNAVYDSESGAVENLVISDSEFAGCVYAVILRSENGEFTGNTVNGGRLNVMNENQTVTGNSFEDESRIKFYDESTAFEQNSISADSVLAANTGVTGIDVSNNYWGGGKPSDAQLGGVEVTGDDVYYTSPDMEPEDLNTYKPPSVPDPNPITITQPANGTISTNFSNASVGATITVTATPNSGYELAYITVNGEKIDGNTFTMPDKAVTVSAVFVPATGGFSDVVPGAWYVDAVNYVVSNGLMEGTSATTFEPDARMTRAMFWTILARIDGETITGATWADAARAWAVANNVSDGTNPHSPLTREQLVTMLWRYLGEPETTGSLSAYTDANTVSEWAKTAMAWAIEKGIITGVTTTTLAPQSIATRAQCATILMRNAF